MFSPLELIGYLVIVTALAGTLGYRWAVSQLEPKLRKAQQGLARADQTVQQQRRTAEELQHEKVRNLAGGINRWADRIDKTLPRY